MHVRGYCGRLRGSIRDGGKFDLGFVVVLADAWM